MATKLQRMVDQYALTYLAVDDGVTTSWSHDKHDSISSSTGPITTKLGRIVDNHAPTFLAGEDGVTTSSSFDKYLWISLHFYNPITTKLI